MDTSNFVISVRKAKKPNTPEGSFCNEPGVTRYLEVPVGEDTPHPHTHKLTRTEWLKRVLDRASEGVHGADHPLSGYRYGDILIFIHGYNNSMQEVMDRHNKLQKNLRAQGFKGAIVSFDWPSASATLNYLEDRSDAKATASRLVKDGIAVLATNQKDQDRNKCDIDVHLLGHSTGAYVVREGFYEATQHRTISRTNWQVSQIVLIGGDIARKSLRASDDKSKAFFTHAARITNYQNPYDIALKVSNVKRLGTQPRAGRVGLPDNPPENVVNVNLGDHWKTLERNPDYSKTSWSHSWHFEDETFAKDLACTLQGDIDRHKIPTRIVVDGVLTLKAQL
ncbi:MAG: alpha/beta hydrolase [Kordiimonadaceae bacterium]|nr:alpha/beta hydrolase [Kordiimonadaceae bacterium]